MASSRRKSSAEDHKESPPDSFPSELVSFDTGTDVFSKQRLSGSFSSSSKLSEQLKLETRTKNREFTVFMHCFDLEEDEVPILHIRLSRSLTADDFIFRILDQHAKENKLPERSIALESSLYCLRTTEYDGTPEMDLPPIDVDADLYNTGCTTLALCRRENVSLSSILSREHFLPDLPNMKLIRVIFGDVKTIAKYSSFSTLEHLLPQIKFLSKQTKEAYTFFHPDEPNDPLPWDIRVSELHTNRLLLKEKELHVAPSSGIRRVSDFLFTKETALKPIEYTVFKETTFGRQIPLLLTISTTQILLRRNPKASVVSGISSLREKRLSAKHSAHQLEYVVEAEILALGSCKFVVRYRDTRANKISGYVYEAETPDLCAEIVARIKYIRSHCSPLSISSNT